jgi:hypothetical protein
MTPSTTSALSENSLVGIGTLEARAKEKKKQYLTEQKVYQQSLITFENLREELEETERAIGDFDDGTCPVCHNQPAKTFADLKAKRTELETKLAKANEEKEEKNVLLYDISLEVNNLETEIHQELLRQRGKL